MNRSIMDRTLIGAPATVNHLHSPPPSSQLLYAFAVTAQLGTVAAASQALHITPSAVSKQILELEAWLGVALFTRVRKRLQLTPTGQRYLASVKPLLSQLEAATLEAKSSPLNGWMLSLAVTPTFGSKWLIPRLRSFFEAHPDIELRFSSYSQARDFTQPDLDCAIHGGEPPWPAVVAERLAGGGVVLIAPPKSRNLAALRRPADVAHHRLIHHASVPHIWPDWCEANAVEGFNPYRGLRLDYYDAVISAVAEGLGLGLVPGCLVEKEIARGDVSAPEWAAGRGMRDSAGYYLCYPEAKSELEPLVVFRRWLQAQAQM